MIRDGIITAQKGRDLLWCDRTGRVATVSGDADFMRTAVDHLTIEPSLTEPRLGPLTRDDAIALAAASEFGQGVKQGAQVDGKLTGWRAALGAIPSWARIPAHPNGPVWIVSFRTQTPTHLEWGAILVDNTAGIRAGGFSGWDNYPSALARLPDQATRP